VTESDDQPNSWLVMVHVRPIPEQFETRAVFDRITRIVKEDLPGYEVDVEALYASSVDVVGLDDLDALETIEDL